MKKNKTKLICIIVVIILFIIALPTGVYAYNYNQYKNNFNKAIYQLDNEKYDESIKAFKDISVTYFGKRDLEKIKKEIEKAKKFKENKKVYDEALKLFNDKKYLEVIDSLKKIPKDDTKRYEIAQKKINECKSLYISLNIENAKNEAKSNNYDSAINYLTLVLTLDATNKDASNLKDEYIKAKEAAELKAKQEAEAKAKQEAEAKTKQEATAKQVATAKPKQETGAKSNLKIAIIPKPGFGIHQGYTPTQVSGNEAIKNEFKKMGFVFQSDTKATYTNDGINVDLEYIEDGGEKGRCWAIYTNTMNYGSKEDQLFEDAMVIILGHDRALNNLTYIHDALATDESFSTPDIKTLTYNQKIYLFIYIPK